MKKPFIFTLIIAALCCTFSAQAKPSYRGFINVQAGAVTGQKTTGDYDLGKPSGISPMFTTTHGVQLNRSFFVGAGAGFALTQGWDGGGNHNSIDQFLTVPIFIDLRWELNITKRVTPFIDIKGGYNQNVGTYDNLGEPYQPHPDVRAKHGTFVQPTVGLRFRWGRKFGFSIGASYNTGVKTAVYDTAGKETGTCTNPRASLNLGFDF